jgi:hypothetical protein
MRYSNDPIQWQLAISSDLVSRILRYSKNQSGTFYCAFAQENSDLQAKIDRFSAGFGLLTRKKGSIGKVQRFRKFFPPVLSSALSGN